MSSLKPHQHPPETLDHSEALLTDDERRRRLRRMKAVVTGTLLGLAVLFVVAFVLQEKYSGWAVGNRAFFIEAVASRSPGWVPSVVDRMLGERIHLLIESQPI